MNSIGKGNADCPHEFGVKVSVATSLQRCRGGQSVLTSRLCRAIRATGRDMTDLRTNMSAMIESVSALTLATHDMPRAVRFYVAHGFNLIYGGEDARFTSFRAGSGDLGRVRRRR